ncbi:hypothetical protein [Paraliobacillus sp. JSM ZJ581]|uniref:hypothetical protein n=1 Tax=Paraliobacillus sp. JSM ZJ581 TaxID=3342118 RepID=UPI0035A83252
MSKTIFNAKQMDILEQNPNGDKVSDHSITYSSRFKIRAAKERLECKGPQQIFIDNGFNLKFIGFRKPNQCLRR